MQQCFGENIYILKLILETYLANFQKNFEQIVNSKQTFEKFLHK